jgi:hypothetical protein
MHEQKIVPVAIAVAMILGIQGEVLADPSSAKPQRAPVVLTVYSDYV